MKAVTEHPPSYDGQCKTCPECGSVWMYFFGVWKFMCFSKQEGA